MKRYIVFEGCDYTGKTTLAKELTHYIAAHTPYKPVYTKEPGCPFLKPCFDIRKLIINATDIQNKETYSYLFAADSYEHMTSFVIPDLNGDPNRVVVSDRAMISDFAYRPILNHDIRGHNFKIFQALDPLIIWCRALPEVIEERYARRLSTNEFERIHVMDKIIDIDAAYARFFYEHQYLNVIEHFSINDNYDMHHQEYLFEKIVGF